MSARFSIVLPTLNRRDMLVGALASIDHQLFPDVEIVLVDGGSDDGTLQLVEARRDVVLVKNVKGGVYNGFNHGAAVATGEIVGFLNDDDVYEPGTFAAVSRTFAEHPDVEAVCGSTVLETSDRILSVFDDDNDKALTKARTVFIGNHTINSRFFRRAALTRIGEFNLDYPYVSDRDWLARCYLLSIRTIALSMPIYRYRSHPASLTFSGNPVRRLGIREDLLRLARNWREKAAPGSEIEQVLPLLEGRCLVTLIAEALRRRDIGRAWRLMSQDGQRYSHRPITAMVRGGLDVVTQQVRAWGVPDKVKGRS
jgi:glycosyltransferase involved in cell wall biosynthesis